MWLLKIHSESGWVVGINQNRDQAPFFVNRNAVHDPRPEGICLATPGISPGGCNIIVIPWKTGRGLSRFMPYRCDHRNYLFPVLFQPLDFVYLIDGKRNKEAQSTYC